MRRSEKFFLSFAAAFCMIFLTAASSDPESLTVWESPVFTGDGAEYYPDDLITLDGQDFELVSFELVPVEQEGDSIFADASVEFLLEGNEEPPESAVITLTNEGTGSEYEREVPLMKTVEKDIFWSDDFSFEITVTDYDAELYILDDTYIMAGEDLKDYGEELIESLGLPGDRYRVNDVTWRGAPYEYEGVIMRDAVASGEKLVRSVEAVYGGNVMTPAVKGDRYVAYYMPVTVKETEEETEEETEREEEPETITQTEEVRTEETMPEEVPGMIERLFRWIREHFSVVTLGVGFLVILLLGLILLFESGRSGRSDRR